MFNHGRSCLFVGFFVLFFSHGSRLLGATPEENQLNQWMMFDSYLDDQDKVAIATSELEATRKEALLLNDLVRMYQELYDRGNATAEETLRDYKSQALKADAKVRALEHRTEFYSIGSQISDQLLAWYTGRDVDFTKIQDLYWRRWEHRCAGYANNVEEMLARKDFVEWRLTASRALQAQRAISREEVDKIENDLNQVKARLNAVTHLRDACKDGPPFPRLSDFAHLKRTGTGK